MKDENFLSDNKRCIYLVDKDEIVKNDYNISTSRYIQINDAETYKPIGEIVEELKELEEEAAEIDKEVKTIFKGWEYEQKEH